MKSPFSTYKMPFSEEDFRLARNFSVSMYKEMAGFVKDVIFFGSATNSGREQIHEHDIDVLVLLEDQHYILSPEVTETYRVITEKIASQISKRLHITTMRVSNWWEYVLNGDPVLVNILRQGIPLLESGFIEPFKEMLKRGEIIPTKENVHVYLQRAPQTVHASQWHLLQGVIDMQWAFIDAAHAVLLFENIVPLSPIDSFDKLDNVFVKSRKLDKKHVALGRRLHDLTKKIVSRDLVRCNGNEFENLFEQTKHSVGVLNDLVTRLKEERRNG